MPGASMASAARSTASLLGESACRSGLPAADGSASTGMGASATGGLTGATSGIGLGIAGSGTLVPPLPPTYTSPPDHDALPPPAEVTSSTRTRAPAWRASMAAQAPTC